MRSRPLIVYTAKLSSVTGAVYPTQLLPACARQELVIYADVRSVCVPASVAQATLSADGTTLYVLGTTFPRPGQKPECTFNASLYAVQASTGTIQWLNNLGPSISFENLPVNDPLSVGFSDWTELGDFAGWRLLPNLESTAIGVRGYFHYLPPPPGPPPTPDTPPPNSYWPMQVFGSKSGDTLWETTFENEKNRAYTGAFAVAHKSLLYFNSSSGHGDGQPETFPHTAMTSFDWTTGKQILTVSQMIPTIPNQQSYCHDSAAGCAGYISTEGDVPLVALANGTVLLQVSFVGTYEWTALQLIDTGSATCPTVDHLAHATFPKGVVVPISMLPACSSTVGGACHAPYTGTMDAQCCWDPTSWSAYWNASASSDDCGIPAAACPVHNDTLHAAFPGGYTVGKTAGSCTAVVPGTCTPGYRGVVTASCCWDPRNLSAVWKLPPLATSNCSKITSCPKSSESLHATFVPGTTVLEREHACTVADGECSEGFVGAIQAECCWETTYDGAEWNNRSTWTNATGTCTPEWRMPVIIGAVALCSLCAGSWISLVVCRRCRSSPTAASAYETGGSTDDADGTQSPLIYEDV